MAKPKFYSVVKDLSIAQSDDYRFQLTLKQDEHTPLDITGYKFRCKVSPDTESTDILLMAEVKIIDPAKGVVEFHFKNEDTEKIDTEGLTYDEVLTLAYDVQCITPDDDVIRLLCGSLFVSPTVSWKGEVVNEGDAETVEREP